MLRTNLLQKSEIRMKPKSTRETWKVPVKPQISYWPWNTKFGRDTFWKNARDIFVVARVDVAKKVPVNAKSADEDFEKKVSWEEKVSRGIKQTMSKKQLSAVTTATYTHHLKMVMVSSEVNI